MSRAKGKNIWLVLPESEHERLEEAARRQDRSMTRQVRRYIRKGLEDDGLPAPQKERVPTNRD